MVLFTLTVNGMSSRYVLELLKLNRGSPESRLFLRSALSHMRSQTAAAMREMRDDPKFHAVQWSVLRPFLPQALISEVETETEPQRGSERELPHASSRSLSHLSKRELWDGGEAAGLPDTEEGRETGRAAAEAGAAHGAGGLGVRFSLQFPPSHPVHGLQLLAQEPGDLTLMQMPTLQFRQHMRLDAHDDDDDDDDGGQQAADEQQRKQDTAAAPASPRGELRLQLPAFQSATVGARSPSNAPQPPPPAARRQRSSLMAVFDEPDDDEKKTLAAGSPRSPPPPPPGPPAPPLSSSSSAASQAASSAADDELAAPCSQSPLVPALALPAGSGSRQLAT